MQASCNILAELYRLIAATYLQNCNVLRPPSSEQKQVKLNVGLLVHHGIPR